MRNAIFLPFAAVTRTWDEYAATVREALAPLGLSLDSAHALRNAAAEIEAARLIIVGGGNTFHLLHHCRERGLLEPVARRIRAGAKYLGWSAGSNLACPTIKTTNDMPIVDPRGLEALGLIDFQINPHYTNALPPGVQGESRNQRLIEYVRANPEVPAIGLPEGDWIRVSGSRMELCGPHEAVLFKDGAEPRSLKPGPLEWR
jgi:dipeptidase E